MANSEGYKRTTVPRAGDDAHPFGMPWLDSCYQETLLPDGPWHPIAEQICEQLADRIRKQNLYPERRQILFELMGKDFMQTYFGDEHTDPAIILPPLYSLEDRRRLQVDAQKWLKAAMQQITADLNLPQVDNSPNQPGWLLQFLTKSGPDYDEKTKKFINKTHGIFQKGIDRHLLIQEEEIERRWEVLQQQSQDAKEAQQSMRDRERELKRIQKERERLYGSSRIPESRAATKGSRAPKSILKNSGSRMDTETSSSGLSRATTANVKGALFGTSSDPPIFWGMQSNSLGRSLIAILKRDPRRFPQVVVTLRGRQLPGALRQYIWLDVMYREERQKQAGATGDVESLVRQNFAAAVSKGQTSLKIKKPTHSPIASLIETNVLETFKSTPSMFPYREETEFLRDTAKSLNVLYVYNRMYETYLVYWLFPLQLAFHHDEPEAEHPYDLALYHDLMRRHLIPTWPRIFAIAQQVLEIVQHADPTLHRHLEIIADRNPALDTNSKDFMVNLIHLEKAEASGQSSSIRPHEINFAQNPESRKLLANPLIFIRKWIGEAFVGALDTQAALFVWDQCFLYSWKEEILRDICVILILLLSHNFMEATDYSSMRQVFFNEPSLLYTMDIQRAFQFLRASREQFPNDPVDYPEIPPMNRRRPRDLPPPPTPLNIEAPRPPSLPPPAPSSAPRPAEETPAPSRPLTAVSEAPVKVLDPIGLKRVKILLEIPQEGVTKVPWLNSLATDRFRLKFTVMFGSLELFTKDMAVKPAVTKDVDPAGTLIYRLDYKYNKVIFDEFDIGRYDIEFDMGGYPHAVAELLYTPLQGDPVALGWARIKLYQREDTGEEEGVGQSQWSMMLGDCTYTLYSGPSLERFGDNKTPKFTKPDAASIAQSYISLRSLDSVYLGQFGDLLGKNSAITALIIDPSREPATPANGATPANVATPAPAPRTSKETGKKKK